MNMTVIIVLGVFVEFVAKFLQGIIDFHAADELPAVLVDAASLSVTRSSDGYQNKLVEKMVAVSPFVFGDVIQGPLFGVMLLQVLDRDGDGSLSKTPATRNFSIR